MKIPIVSPGELAAGTLNYFDPETGQFMIAPNTPEYRRKKAEAGELLIWQDAEGNIIIAKDTPENRKEYESVKQNAL